MAGARAGRVRERGGQRARRAARQHRADAEPGVAQRAQAPDQRDRQQRVAAEREEVVVRAGELAAEQLAHDAGDPQRLRAGRRPVDSGRRPRLGQRVTVDLAALVSGIASSVITSTGHTSRGTLRDVRAQRLAVERRAGASDA